MFWSALRLIPNHSKGCRKTFETIRISQTKWIPYIHCSPSHNTNNIGRACVFLLNIYIESISKNWAVHFKKSMFSSLSVIYITETYYGIDTYLFSPSGLVEVFHLYMPIRKENIDKLAFLPKCVFRRFFYIRWKGYLHKIGQKSMKIKYIHFYNTFYQKIKEYPLHWCIKQYSTCTDKRASVI